MDTWIYFFILKSLPMESVKSAIVRGINERHGECVLRMDAADLCMVICVKRCMEYIIYVRPNAAETQFMCHYAHRDDVEERRCFHHVMLEDLGDEWIKHQKSKNESARKDGKSELIECKCESAEVQKWRQQEKFRLVRVVEGAMKKFASVAIQYVDDAVERIRVFEAVEGDELRMKPVKTFAEARSVIELFPRPVKPPRKLPEPVVRRNKNVYPRQTIVKAPKSQSSLQQQTARRTASAE